MSIVKQKARELHNEFYMILFDSDSDKEGCLISILAKNCAVVCANEIKHNVTGIQAKQLWDNVIHEIKML